MSLVDFHRDMFPIGTWVVVDEDARYVGRYRGVLGLNCGSTIARGQHQIKWANYAGTDYVPRDSLRELDWREIRSMGLDE